MYTIMMYTSPPHRSDSLSPARPAGGAGGGAEMIARLLLDWLEGLGEEQR